MQANDFATDAIDKAGIQGDLREQLIDELRESALGRGDFDWSRIPGFRRDQTLSNEHGEMYEKWKRLKETSEREKESPPET